MSDAATTISAEAAVAAPPRRRSRGAWLSLFLKELRESRGLLIAGLWTCWLMPAALEVPYMLVMEGRLCFIPIVGVTLVSVGWFFAIVTGAQVVCRDWGRAEEHFLRAQPVSPGAIVFAKWWAGLLVVAVVVLVPAIWTGVFMALDPIIHARPDDPDLRVLVSTFGIVFLTGFAIAFATAFVTRQMLTSVLTGVLAIVGWWMAPWLSHRFDFLRPAFMQQDRVVAYESERGAMLGAAFTVTVLFVVLAAWLAASWAARRELAIRVAPKSLAWGVAAIVLVVFTAAMNEVGSTLAIRDHHVLPSEYGAVTSQHVLILERKFTSSGDTGFILAPRSWDHMPIARFRLTATGKIAELQTTDLWPTLRIPERSVAVAVPEFSAAGPDQLRMTIVTASASRRSNQSMGLARVRLGWPAVGGATQISKREQKLPEDPGDDAYYLNFAGAVTTEKYSYLLIQAWPKTPAGEPRMDPQGNAKWHYRLYVFDWSEKSESDVARMIRLPDHWGNSTRQSMDLALVAGKLVLFSTNYPGALAFAFDPNDPAGWTDALEKGAPSPAPDFYAMAGVTQTTRVPQWFSSCGYPAQSVAYDGSRDLIYFDGSQVLGVCPAGDDGIIREEPLGIYRFNVLSTLLRSQQMGLQIIDGNRLLEKSSQVLSVFDVSDPRHPRRLGFFNVASSTNMDVFPLGDHLLLLEGRSLTVLDLPTAGS